MLKNKLTLSRDDQRAIDAVLNHGSTTHLTAAREVAPPSKINAVNKILSLLNSIPPTDPPAGLLDRTMQLIEGADTRRLAHRSSHGTNHATHLH